MWMSIKKPLELFKKINTCKIVSDGYKWIMSKLTIEEETIMATSFINIHKYQPQPSLEAFLCEKRKRIDR